MTTYSRPTPCQHTELAAGELGQVTFCPDCGAVHLSLMYMSVRLEAPAFRALATMVEAAQRQLDQATVPPAHAPAAWPARADGKLH